MMKEYEDMLGSLWGAFQALPPPDKVGVGGALVAAIMVMFPWSVSLEATGMAKENIGLGGMGLIGLLLALASLGLTYFRLTQKKAQELPRELRLAQVGVAVAGLLWSLAALVSASGLEVTLPDNPYHVDPGPAYGLYFHLIAWVVAGIGAIVSLRDLPSGPSRRKPRP